MSAFILPGHPVKLQQSSSEPQQQSAEPQQQSGECKPPPVVDSNNSGNATATQLQCCIILMFVCIHMEALFQGCRKIARFAKGSYTCIQFLDFKYR